MADFILMTGDQAIFIPMFGAATVVVMPGVLKGSGPATLRGQKICVDGDEAKLSVPACLYMTPQYAIPGMGTLKIKALASDQVAKKNNSGGKAILLKGSQFDAVFEVQSPAQQPPPGPGAPIPDSTPNYNGKGMFITMNTHFQGG